MKTALRVALGTALFATASCHSSQARPEPGVPPGALGSPPVTFPCPPGFDFAAYGRLVYPPFHPLRPDFTVRPKRCFSSLSQAESADYRVAPPPPGGALIDGVYLVSSPKGLHGACERAARQLGFPIPCPTLVPTGWDPDTSSVAGRGLFVLTSTFGPAAAEYVGLTAGAGHLNIWAVRASLYGSPNGYDFCPGGKRAGTVRVAARSATWIVCPEGSVLDGDHIDLEWAEHGVIYAVSLHGHTEANRMLDLAIAEHLQMVR